MAFKLKTSETRRAAPKRGFCLGQSLCGFLYVLSRRDAGFRLQPAEIIGGLLRVAYGHGLKRRGSARQGA
jgi:hypothetical protein